MGGRLVVGLCPDNRLFGAIYVVRYISLFALLIYIAKIMLNFYLAKYNDVAFEKMRWAD